MRALILLAGAALALSACGNNDQGDNNMNVDEKLSAENIVANDVTAIDAVTGDSANMAADVDINFTNDMLDGAEGNASSAGDRSTTKPRPPARTPPSPAPSPQPSEPAANMAANVSE